jgi:hypothetical protein
MNVGDLFNYDAEHFILQCDRIDARRQMRDISEVAPRRIVSRDFASGVADASWTDFSSGLPVQEQL